MAVVPFVRFATVFPLIEFVPVPAQCIPYTFCPPTVEVELALILFADVALPIVLLLIDVVPDTLVFLIP